MPRRTTGGEEGGGGLPRSRRARAPHSARRASLATRAMATDDSAQEDVELVGVLRRRRDARRRSPRHQQLLVAARPRKDPEAVDQGGGSAERLRDHGASTRGGTLAAVAALLRCPRAPSGRCDTASAVQRIAGPDLRRADAPYQRGNRPAAVL